MHTLLATPPESPAHIPLATHLRACALPSCRQRHLPPRIRRGILSGVPLHAESAVPILMAPWVRKRGGGGYLQANLWSSSFTRFGKRFSHVLGIHGSTEMLLATAIPVFWVASWLGHLEQETRTPNGRRSEGPPNRVPEVISHGRRSEGQRPPNRAPEVISHGRRSDAARARDGLALEARSSSRWAWP